MRRVESRDRSVSDGCCIAFAFFESFFFKVCRVWIWIRWMCHHDVGCFLCLHFGLFLVLLEVACLRLRGTRVFRVVCFFVQISLGLIWTRWVCHHDVGCFLCLHFGLFLVLLEVACLRASGTRSFCVVCFQSSVGLGQMDVTSWCWLFFVFSLA